MSPPRPSLSGWHPEDVKAAIRKKGVTLSELSLLNGFSDAYLRNALKRPIFEAERIIAAFLGLYPQVIWPDRYNAKGEPDYAEWRRQRDERLRTARTRRAA